LGELHITLHLQVLFLHMVFSRSVWGVFSPPGGPARSIDVPSAGTVPCLRLLRKQSPSQFLHGEQTMLGGVHLCVGAGHGVVRSGCGVVLVACLDAG
jgi:hypothetical protein